MGHPYLNVAIFKHNYCIISIRNNTPFLRVCPRQGREEKIYMARTPRFVPEAAKMGTDPAEGTGKRDIAPARKPFPDVELHPPERAGQSLNRALEESFARVREDIVQIKKALNDQAEQMSQLGAKVEGFVNMYEFFEY